MPVPYTFGTATAAIPLSQLDSNFATAVTIGNTAVQLGNTVTTLNNMTLANVTISSGSVTITNVSVTTANVSGTANVSTMVIIGNESVGGNTTVTGNISANNATLTTNLTLSGGTANGVAYLNGSKVVTTGSALTFDGNVFSTQKSTSGDALKWASATGKTAYGYADGSGIGLFTGASVTGTGFYANDTSSYFATYIAGSEQMRLTSTGLGIGTTSPSTPLHIQAATTGGFAIRIKGRSSDGYGDISFYNNANTVSYAFYGANNAAAYLGSAAAIPLAFYTNNAEVGRFDASGNLLVGTTDANPNSGNGVKINAGTAARTSVVGSADTNANFALTVYSTTAAAYRFQVGYGGTIYATSIVITAISDQRLKENVRDIDTGLDAIMALKPRRFDWKEGQGQNKKNAAGFIAQEFEDVFPECVGTSKAGEDGIEYKNINHETLIPTLVKAIQEQQALITQLTTRLTALENK